MIKDAIKKVKAKNDLTEEEMASVFSEIMSGSAQKDSVKEFLLSLKEKGESAEEIFAAAEVMREKSVKVNVPTENLIDTCGTGGAVIHDINVSTLSAIVLASCGIKVAKHGNRSFTGKCGSADILQELGVNVNLNPEKVAELIETTGFGFIFAPLYHPAMKNVMEARKELATKTIFNILGPLSNPAGAKMQILGVYKPELTELMANALNKLGSPKAYVVHGLKGLDEISIAGETQISELENGKVQTRRISPEDFGMREASLDSIKGGTKDYNKKIALEILDGSDRSSRRDMVLMNAAAALKMVGRVKDFKQGVVIAARAIDSGAALATLEKIKVLSVQK